ncbi:hypothetical protein EDD16DRAFT_1523275 [Pisolithus croceorrhizus]|nr:hypothetical protein EDD16DRAFT_1523275 [Pisolithus croceorrhizus]
MGMPGGFGCVLIAGLISAMLYGITVLQGSVKRNLHAGSPLTTNYSDLCVLHDALLRGYLNREISRCCHMVNETTTPECRSDLLMPSQHFGYPTRLLQEYISNSQLQVITSYGVPTNLEYIVWFVCLPFEKVLPADETGRSYPASAVVQLLIVIMVQLLSPWSEVVGDRPDWFGMVLPTHFAETLIPYYSVTPSAVAVVVAEVLITVSLCVILYDGGSYSACPRAKPLINTITTYAANRCLLTSIVVIAELAVNVDQQALWTMGLNFIVGKSSLNAREHLWSQGSTSMSILNISSLRFADPPTLPKDRRKSQVGERQFNVREAADTWSGV